MIEPHGGSLINKALPKLERESLIREIGEFHHIAVNIPKWKEIKNISYGIFSPLEGFMNQNEMINVLDHMYLESEIACPIPIVLDVNREEILDLKADDNIILTEKEDNPLA